MSCEAVVSISVGVFRNVATKASGGVVRDQEAAPGKDRDSDRASESEPEASPYVLNSDDVTDAFMWEAANTATSSGVEITSEGSLAELVPTASLAEHYIQTKPITFRANRSYKVDFVVKSTSALNLSTSLTAGAFAGGAEASINMVTGAVNTLGANNPVVAIETLAGGLYRVNMTAVSTTATTSRLRLSLLSLVYASTFANLTSAALRIGKVRIR